MKVIDRNENKIEARTVAAALRSHEPEGVQQMNNPIEFKGNLSPLEPERKGESTGDSIDEKPEANATVDQSNDHSKPTEASFVVSSPQANPATRATSTPKNVTPPAIGEGTTTLAPIAKSEKMVDGLVPIDKLKPHPENVKIYGEKDSVEDLIKSIRANGVLESLLITKDGLIIGGHRRHRALLSLKIAEVPVRVFASDDETDILNALLEHNRHRVKTKLQIAHEAELEMRVQAAKAARRKAANGDVEKLPPGESGKARDVVGKKFGLSGKSAEKAVRIAKTINDLEAKGKTEDAAELKAALNKGFDTGHKLAIKRGHIAAPKGKSKDASKKTTAKGDAAAPVPTTLPNATAKITSEPSEKIESTPRAPADSTRIRINSDNARTYAGHVVTFLRGNEAKNLADQERRDWTKVLDQIANYRKPLGF